MLAVSLQGLSSMVGSAIASDIKKEVAKEVAYARSRGLRQQAVRAGVLAADFTLLGNQDLILVRR